MKKNTYTFTLGVLFIITVVLFSFANRASKVLEVNNPVKTVKKIPAAKEVLATVNESSSEKINTK